MTIEQALTHVEMFEQWAVAKATSGDLVGQPGSANDCPICHYLKDVTDKEVFIGLDMCSKGVWWSTQNSRHFKPLTPTFEALRKKIDCYVSISSESLLALIREEDKSAA